MSNNEEQFKPPVNEEGPEVLGLNEQPIPGADMKVAGPQPGDVLKAQDMPMAMKLMEKFQSVRAGGQVSFFTLFDNVRQFRAVADQFNGNITETPDEFNVNLLGNIVHEEVNKELMPLLEKARHTVLTISEKAQLLDHVVDSIYVLLSIPAVFGLPFDQAWEIVHMANMSKIPTDTGPIKNANGKVMKPEGWTPPDLALLQLCQGLWEQVMAQQKQLATRPVPVPGPTTAQ